MMTTTTYTVTGMTCDHCVAAVTAELSSLPGVHQVRVELSSGSVTVDSDNLLSVDAVREAVDEAGYTLSHA